MIQITMLNSQIHMWKLLAKKLKNFTTFNEIENSFTNLSNREKFYFTKYMNTNIGNDIDMYSVSGNHFCHNNRVIDHFKKKKKIYFKKHLVSNTSCFFYSQSSWLADFLKHCFLSRWKFKFSIKIKDNDESRELKEEYNKTK